MIRLLSIAYAGPSLRNIGPVQHIDAVMPDPRWLGWRVLIRGPITHLVSPPGWENGKPQAAWANPRGPMTVHSVATAHCQFQWSTDDVAEIGKLTTWDSPAFERKDPSAKPAAPEMTDEDLEKATKPADKVKK